jgi:hypothetical protein
LAAREYTTRPIDLLVNKDVYQDAFHSNASLR